MCLPVLYCISLIPETTKFSYFPTLIHQQFSNYYIFGLHCFTIYDFKHCCFCCWFDFHKKTKQNKNLKMYFGIEFGQNMSSFWKFPKYTFALLCSKFMWNDVLSIGDYKNQNTTTLQNIEDDLNPAESNIQPWFHSLCK